jgi:hypothetical protein
MSRPKVWNIQPDSGFDKRFVGTWTVSHVRLVFELVRQTQAVTVSNSSKVGASRTEVGGAKRE